MLYVHESDDIIHEINQHDIQLRVWGWVCGCVWGGGGGEWGGGGLKFRESADPSKLSPAHARTCMWGCLLLAVASVYFQCILDLGHKSFIREVCRPAANLSTAAQYKLLEFLHDHHQSSSSCCRRRHRHRRPPPPPLPPRNTI